MSNENLNPIEIYALQLSNKEPAFFSQIPAIVYYSSYIDESKKRKKLRPISIALYGAIKQLAGTNSACWANRGTLAEMCGCSEGSITMAKKELTRPIEQLNGRSFITIVKKKKKFKDNNGRFRSTDYDHITVNFIWGENNAFMATRKFQKKEEKGSTLSTIDGEGSTLSTIDGVPPCTLSIIDTNNRNNRNTHTVKEQYTAGTACSCDSSHEDSVTSEPDPNPTTINDQYTDTPSYYESDAPINQQYTDQLDKCIHALEKFGCDANFIKELNRKYQPQRIIDAGVYTERQDKRGKIAGSRLGYFRRAVEGQWKWKEKVNV